MAKTRQTAHKSTGGKAPRSKTALKAARKAWLSKPKLPNKVSWRTQASEEIRLWQKTTSLLLRKAPFVRVVRDVAEEVVKKDDINGGCTLRWRTGAIETLQHGAKDFMSELLSDAQIAAEQARRLTITPRDVVLAIQMRRLDRRPLSELEPATVAKSDARRGRRGSVRGDVGLF